jgi:hypothetical protein
MKEAKCEEAGENVGHTHCRPEVSQSDSHLRMLIEVRKVQNNLHHVSQAVGLGRKETAYIWDETSLQDSQ